MFKNGPSKRRAPCFSGINCRDGHLLQFGQAQSQRRRSSKAALAAFTFDVNRQTTPPNAFFERIRDFAAFSGAAFFGAAFFVTAGFSGSAAAALLAAHRFFKAATICCPASRRELAFRF